MSPRSARIWFEQDAGVDYDPVDRTPPPPRATPSPGASPPPILYNYGFTDLSTIPETRDVGLIVLDAGAVAGEYPEINTYGELATSAPRTRWAPGIDAVVTVRATA